jgi:hypothetical protein
MTHPRIPFALLAFAAPVAAADPGDPISSNEPQQPREKPETQPIPPPPTGPDKTAADVANAPLPGDEHGRTDPVDGGDSVPRVIGRDLLFLPKLVMEGALTPIRTSVWAMEKYKLTDRYYDLFFNDARTIGLYPTVAYEAGYGVSGIIGGARFVDRDLFGEHEHLALQAAAGTGYFRQLYSVGLRSGDRFGKRFSLELDAGYEKRPRDPFYGIGNANLGTPPENMQIDPINTPVAVQTRYAQDRARVALSSDTRAVSNLHVRVNGALSRLTFAPSEFGIPIDQTFDTTQLGGFDNGITYGYGELELRWDGRTAVSELEGKGMTSIGSLASAFGGRMHNLGGAMEGADFWRYGVDYQHFIRLAAGPRVLALRFHGEGVTGGYSDVPFAELPTLGGPVYLRGYDLDRFRDRVAAFGTAEYQWDLSAWFNASLFVDAGRVYGNLDELTLSHMRLGYGGSISMHTDSSFVMEASIASSIDGGIFFNLAFNPVFDLSERVRRR